MGHIGPTWKAFRAVNSSCHQRRKAFLRAELVISSWLKHPLTYPRFEATLYNFIYVYACDTYVHAYIYNHTYIKIYIHTYCRIKSAGYKKRGIAQPINRVCGGLPGHQPDPRAVGGICRFYKFVDSDIVDMGMLIWVFLRTGPQYTYIYTYIYIYVYIYIYIMDTFGGLLTSIRTSFSWNSARPTGVTSIGNSQLVFNTHVLRNTSRLYINKFSVYIYYVLILWSMWNTVLHRSCAYLNIMAMCRHVGRSKDKMVRTPLAYGMDFEDVRFKAMDGCTLAAWYIPATRTWSGEMVARLFRWFSSDWFSGESPQGLLFAMDNWDAWKRWTGVVCYECRARSYTTKKGWLDTNHHQ